MDEEGEILFNEALGAILDNQADLKNEMAAIRAALEKESGHTERQPREIREIVEAEKKAHREKVRRIADQHEAQSLLDSLEDVSSEVRTPIYKEVGRLTDKRLIDRARRRRRRLADA